MQKFTIVDLSLQDCLLGSELDGVHPSVQTVPFFPECQQVPRAPRKGGDPSLPGSVKPMAGLAQTPLCHLSRGSILMGRQASYGAKAPFWILWSPVSSSVPGHSKAFWEETA